MKTFLTVKKPPVKYLHHKTALPAALEFTTEQFTSSSLQHLLPIEDSLAKRCLLKLVVHT